MEGEGNNHFGIFNFSDQNFVRGEILTESRKTSGVIWFLNSELFMSADKNSFCFSRILIVSSQVTIVLLIINLQ